MGEPLFSQTHAGDMLDDKNMKVPYVIIVMCVRIIKAALPFQKK